MAVLEILIRVAKAVGGVVAAIIWAAIESIALALGLIGEVAMILVESGRRMQIPIWNRVPRYEPGTILGRIWEGFKEGWDGIANWIGTGPDKP